MPRIESEFNEDTELGAGIKMSQRWLGWWHDSVNTLKNTEFYTLNYTACELCLSQVVTLNSEFSKDTGYKINTPRSILLL